jgi:putative transposase
MEERALSRFGKRISARHLAALGERGVRNVGVGSITGPRTQHQPFRRCEGAMAKFRDIRTLQKFAAVHASIQNHFHQDRHLRRRKIFKQKRSVALAEWRQLAA